MRALLLALFLAGCGSVSGQIAGNVAAEPPVVASFNLPVGGLSGGLATTLSVVSYTDTHNLITTEEATAILQQLDAWVLRQSGGRAWVAGRVVRFTLPGSAVDYAGQFDHNDKQMRHPLQVATRALQTGDPYQVFLVPADVGFTGWGQSDHRRGWAWLGQGSVFPLAHEFGHALGLEHGGGVIAPSGDEAASWEANFDAEALSRLGWLR